MHDAKPYSGVWRGHAFDHAFRQGLKVGSRAEVAARAREHGDTAGRVGLEGDERRVQCGRRGTVHSVADRWAVHHL